MKLSWPGKVEAIAEARTVTSRHVAIPESDLLLIEGDSLDALKVLREYRRERVDLVYIDPPYNTGKAFTYDDRFASHSEWLNFLYPRLLLARELLAPTGALVVHIDENEQARLQLVLEEIFGGENSLGSIIWDKRNPKGDSAGKISCQHETLLAFARDRELFTGRGLLRRKKRNAEKLLGKARELHASGIGNAAMNRAFQDWIRRQSDLSGGEAAYNKIDDRGEVYRLVSMAWPNKKRAPDPYFIPLAHPSTGQDCPVPRRGWRYPPETLRDLIARGEIVFGTDHSVQPQRKYLLSENRFENLPSVLPYGGSDDALLEEMGVPFDNPKPLGFCKQVLEAFSKEGDLVLDFFAGSGTAGHAALELGRAFIGVQTPEPVGAKSAARAAGFSDIAELCEARLKRALERLETAASRLATVRLPRRSAADPR